MKDTLLVVLSAAVGAVVADLGHLWSTPLEARRVIHERIHESRSRLYPAAWQLTGWLPHRPRTERVSYASAARLAVEMRDWSCSEGGMFLSGGARRAYPGLQDTIQEVLAGKEPAAELSQADYDSVRAAGSHLRAWLTRDLLSRSRAPARDRSRELTG